MSFNRERCNCYKHRTRGKRCQTPEQCRNGSRPNPNFLWIFAGPPNCMRLSAKKAAHRFSPLVPRCRKFGKRQAFSWFSSKENHTSRSFSVHSNCETALIQAHAKKLLHSGGS